jgi:sugar lactone lactonase YvrE
VSPTRALPGPTLSALAAAMLAAEALAAIALAAPPGFPGLRPAAQVYEHLDGTAFILPMSVHYDPASQEVFVADASTGTIGIFDPAGVPKYQFPGPRGTGAAASIAVDAGGDIYLLAPGESEIRVLDYRGEPLRALPLGEVEHVSVRGAAMALGPDGLLYVIDLAASRIVAYARDGRFVRMIRGSGRSGERLQNATALAFDSSGNLYVADRRGTPIQIYDPSGAYLRGWGRRDIGPGNFATPAGLDVDAEGNVYVADPVRQDVKIFDPEGNLIYRLGGFGSRPGQMAYPSDVAVGHDGRVYVVERVGRRMQIFDRISRRFVRNPAEPRRTGDSSPSTLGDTR